MIMIIVDYYLLDKIIIICTLFFIILIIYFFIILIMKGYNLPQTSRPRRPLRRCIGAKIAFHSATMNLQNRTKVVGLRHSDAQVRCVYRG